jgi:quinohemoprotein ethanol dehydrogenase
VVARLASSRFLTELEPLGERFGSILGGRLRLEGVSVLSSPRRSVPASLAALVLVAQAVAATGVDQLRLESADRDPGQWMSPGRTWSEQRFSPLKQINDTNVQRLGLAWFAPLNTYRGVEATPLVIDGVLYNISAWDLTTAYDAATGKVLWTYDPQIAPEWSRLACCGPVSRG